MAALGHEFFQAVMGEVHQRARGFQHFQTVPARGLDGALGSAVGGDHDGRRGHAVRLLLKPDALAAHLGEDGLIMDEVAQDGERLMPGGGGGERDGVADPKAHAQMFGAKDFHDGFRLVAVLPAFTLQYKVKDHGGSDSFKKTSGNFILPDDLLQQVDIGGEGGTAGRGEFAGGERAAVLVGLGHGHVTGLLEGADVGGEVAIGHGEGVAELGEREFGGGREHGHDGQPALLMDHPVELEVRFRIHGCRFRFSVNHR